jgi:hypothetical protein
MMVVDPVVVVVFGMMIGHTFDKLVDTTMLMDMNSFDYETHHKDYLWMMMVLLFHLVEIFDVIVYHYHSLMRNSPELKFIIR